MRMKKVFTLCLLMLLGTVTYAQGYVFSDKDGNVYENGKTIERTGFEDDGFGVMLKSGLFVKNQDAPSNYEVAVVANITRIDNGDVQLCFPTNCYNYSVVGTHGGKDKTSLGEGAVKDIQSEWLPTEVGECIVEYTAKNYQGAFPMNDYKVTVHYKYTGTTAFDQVKNSATGRHECFDLQGRPTTASHHGLTIVRMADGSVRKFLH